MIASIRITDNEIRAFFESCGFECKMADAGGFVPAYHGRSEWVDAEQLVVVTPQGEIPAKKLLQATLKAKLLAANSEAKEAIKTALKNL